MGINDFTPPLIILTLSQARMLMIAYLQEAYVQSLKYKLWIVAYHMKRNYTAYCSHKKRKEIRWRKAMMGDICVEDAA